MERDSHQYGYEGGPEGHEVPRDLEGVDERPALQGPTGADARDAWSAQPGGPAQAGTPAQPGTPAQHGTPAQPGAPMQPGAAVPGEEPTSSEAAGQPATAPLSVGPMPGSDAALRLRGQLAEIGLANPFPTVVVGALSYVAALITSVVLMILIGISIAISGSGSSAEQAASEAIGADEVFSGLGTLLRIPFQLVALGTFGSYGMSAEVPWVGEISVTLRLVPAAVTIVLVLACFLGGRLARRLQPHARALGMCLNAVAGGLVTALIVLIMARATAQPIPAEELGTFALHAAGADAFLGALVLSTAALAAGQLLSGPRPRWWAHIADLTSSVRLAAVHAITLTVVLGAWLWAVSAVQAVLDDRAGDALIMLFAAPLLVGQLLAFIPALAGLGSGSVRAQGTAGDLIGGLGGSHTQWFTMFALPWYVWAVGILLGLVVLVAVSSLWSHGRRVVPGSIVSLVSSGAALPIAYLLGSLALMLLGHASFAVSAGGIGDGRASLSLAPWTPLLVLLAGAVVELLSRFLAPLLAPVVPSVLLSWFRRPRADAAAAGAADAPAAPDPAGTTPAAGQNAYLAAIAGQDPAPAAQPGSSAQPDSSTQPDSTAPPSGTIALAAPQLSPRARTAAAIGGIGAGVLVLLAIGVAVAFTVLRSLFFSPQAPVEGYLDALESGSYGRAGELADPNVPHAQRALLDDEIGAATDGGVDGYSIGDVERSGDRAVVPVTLERDGERFETSYTLARTGRAFLLFPRWELQEVPMNEVMVYRLSDADSTVTVNGVALDLAEAEWQMDEEGYEATMLPALPGTYTVEYGDVSPYLEQTPVEVSVPVGEAGYEDQMWAFPTYDVTEAGQEAIVDQVSADLDECAARTSSSPSGCPFSIWASADEGSWTITEYPEVSVENMGEGYYYLSSEYGAGEAEFSYQYEWFDGEVEDRTETTSFTISGYVVFPGDGTIEVHYD